MDLLIKNARVVDGTGRSVYVADVGLVNGKIAEIGQLNAGNSKVLDANGMVLAPGFIDGHTHTDFFILKDPVASVKLKQGVTTEVCGLCGITFAPISKKYLEAGREFYVSQGISLPEDYERYTSFGVLLDAIEGLELSHNLALLVGHGALRFATMGLENRAAKASDLNTMATMLQEAMDAGAFGMSSGLKYAPGVFAEQRELVELCRVVANNGGIYESHMRYQGNRLSESVAETIDIARQTGVTSIISHHKALGAQNWGKVHETVRMIREAIEQEGLPVGHNVYPYSASATLLMVTMPPSVLAMPRDEIVAALQDVEFLQAMKYGIFHPVEEWDNDLLNAGYDSIRVLSAPQTPQAVGKSLAEYAAFRSMDTYDAYIELLVENRLEVYIAVFSISEEDMRFVMQDPHCMIVSDSNIKFGDIATHPRAVGTFPRVLGRYVREAGILELEEAVRKMTSLPADMYGIPHKGRIAVGYDADVVLFDPSTIIDQADFKNTLAPNLGIRAVVVNGEIAVMDGTYTGTASGRLIRKRRPER